MMAKGANRIEINDIKIEDPVSAVATIGLAIPPVVAEEVNRMAAVFPFITAAVPPPAMIAKDHVTKGFKSLTVAIITAVPAIAANGTAMVSRRLSTHGM